MINAFQQSEHELSAMADEVMNYYDPLNLIENTEDETDPPLLPKFAHQTEANEGEITNYLKEFDVAIENFRSAEMESEALGLVADADYYLKNHFTGKHKVPNDFLGDIFPADHKADTFSILASVPHNHPWFSALLGMKVDASTNTETPAEDFPLLEEPEELVEEVMDATSAENINE